LGLRCHLACAQPYQEQAAGEKQRSKTEREAHRASIPKQPASAYMRFANEKRAEVLSTTLTMMTSSLSSSCCQYEPTALTRLLIVPASCRVVPCRAVSCGVSEAKPGLKVTAVSAELGALWKAQTDAQRAPYIAAFQAERKTFASKKAKFLDEQLSALPANIRDSVRTQAPVRTQTPPGRQAFCAVCRVAVWID
jgi:hypothetical protein